MTTTASRITGIRAGFLSGLLIVTTTALSLGGITSWICTAVLDAHVDSSAARAVESVRISRGPRQHCSKLYNNGTGQWAECIGVGKK